MKKSNKFHTMFPFIGRDQTTIVDEVGTRHVDPVLVQQRVEWLVTVLQCSYEEFVTRVMYKEPELKASYSLLATVLSTHDKALFQRWLVLDKFATERKLNANRESIPQICKEYRIECTMLHNKQNAIIKFPHQENGSEMMHRDDVCGFLADNAYPQVEEISFEAHVSERAQKSAFMMIEKKSDGVDRCNNKQGQKKKQKK
jgi:hypothetical protein